MEKPIVRVIFDRRKKASNVVQGSVEIEVYYNRERVRFSTGVNVYKTQWENGIIIEHPNAPRLNTIIREHLEDMEDRVHTMEMEGFINLGFLKSSKQRNHIVKSQTFLEFLRERIYKRSIRESTRKQQLIVYNVLVKYGKIVQFADLNRPNIMAFDEYLHTIGIKQVTIHTYHKRLKPYIKEAILMGIIKKNPYDGILVSRGKAETIKFLTKEERQKIQELDLTGYYDQVRDLFIFSSYTGLAFSDMIKVKKEDFFMEDGEMFIEDTRVKCATRYKLMILPPAKTILEKYDYNLNLISNQKANVILKSIGFLAGIKHNLTMHMARHTFATWALSEGIPIEIVSRMLAHTNITQTQVYAKVLQISVNKGFSFLKEKL